MLIHLKIVLQASRHSPCISGCEKHRCSISASPSHGNYQRLCVISFHLRAYHYFSSKSENQKRVVVKKNKKSMDSGEHHSMKWRVQKNMRSIEVISHPLEKFMFNCQKYIFDCQKYIFDCHPPACDYQLRLILVGKSTVGKTSLIRSPFFKNLYLGDLWH